ncbi:MAG TPA: SpoIIE family protein phosphatase [candidate division Zixibacteria bacterium]|nr:SpoIIE family protein phosphatase [candidate division Zixibacteria bacterium]
MKAVKPGDMIIFGQVEFRLTDDPDAGVRSNLTRLSAVEPERSVYLDISEALKPLPARVTDRPEVVPTIFEMAKLLVLPEPEQVLLERSLGLIARLIPADRLAVLVRGEGDELYTAATLLPEGKDMGEFRLSSTIVREILTDKQSIVVGNPMEDPRFAQQQSIILSEMKSAMAVPLFDEGNVHGILYVDTTNPLHRYSDEYLRLLATFGNILGARMLSYTLQRERQEKHVMEAELARAASIQKNLLVQAYPTPGGYDLHAFQEQSRAVGGDLYDIAALPDEHVLFLVADVSGKGMGAALLMSNILASFRILYDQADFDLCRMVRLVSTQMYRYSAPENFATLFVGVIDAATHEIRFVNAGHNPPIVVRADGRHEHLPASGIMIGAMPFDAWSEERVTLQPGESLVVFTDGVTEAERADGSLFGEDRLEAVLTGARGQAPAHLCETIMKEIRRFVENAPQSDDITMLVVQRKA